MTQNMEISYQRKGDYLFPNLMIEDSLATYGKYGMLRRSFLKENKRNWYQSMMLTGKLESHLKEIDETANARLELMTSDSIWCGFIRSEIVRGKQQRMQYR